MLKKIIAIKNVGCYRNSAAPGNPQLAKHTFIVGANGYGKTTLCAVLRSLQTGMASYVLGRKTLGVGEPQSIELLLSTGTAGFDGTNWNAAYPSIAIFDGVFVSENIHSGEVVELDHKRSLYRVIIGDDGVKLAELESTLAASSRAKTAEISTAAKAVEPHVPPGMRLEIFNDLSGIDDIDTQIENQKRAVESAQQAGAIRDRAPLAEFTLPVLPEGFTHLIAKTIDDIAHDAESLLSEHLSRHGMQASDGNWISAGLKHAESSCPFCGQNIKDLPVIAAFRAAFSERYKALVSEIAAMKISVTQRLGDAVLARLDTVVAQNQAAVDFWVKYCVFDVAPLDFPTDFHPAIRHLREAALALVDRKTATPLEGIVVDEEFSRALAMYGAAAKKVELANVSIQAVNILIAVSKANAGTADIKMAQTELVRRQAVKNRHTAAVASLCLSYRALVEEKGDIEKKKEEVRKKLDTHTKNVVKPYERRINELLLGFNAGFSITETKHAYPGGVATSSYQLVINKVAIDVGDEKTPSDRPSFKNTLSGGDRTTLALAFFLAHLERDPTITGKIVTFDDPFNSQDAFRRRQTVHEIIKVAGKCGQVIVLSHDATFLKQVWDKVSPAERVALTIADHRSLGSKITLGDLEKACQGRTANDMDDLQGYLTTGVGQLIDIIRKMRTVLETHCRTTYPGFFLPSDWLGDIVRKIREGGETHPAHALYDELDQINGYTSQYHHGEDLGDTTPDNIDPSELTGFARRTLRTVNALQA